MINFWKKQNQSILIFGLPIVGLFIVFFLIIPQKKNIDDKTNEIQKMIARHEDKSKKISEIDKMRQQYELIEKNAENMGVVFFSEKVVEVIEKIERIAEETENKISIEIDEGKEDKEDKKKSTDSKKQNETLKPATENYITVKIRLEGSFRSLLEFVNKIEKFDYYADIFSLQTTINKPASASYSGSYANPFVGGSEAPKEKEIEKLTNEQGERIIYSTLDVLFYMN